VPVSVSLIADVFLLVSIFIMMLLMNWRLTLVVLLAVVPVGIMLQVLGFALRRVWVLFDVWSLV